MDQRYGRWTWTTATVVMALVTVASADEGINVARDTWGAIAWASSAYQGDYHATNALDGRWATQTTDKWNTAPNRTGHWMIVDLGQVRTIDRIVIRHEKGRAITSDFTLQRAETPKGPWKNLLAPIKNNREAVSTHEFTAVATRYVRLEVTKGEQNANEYARIYEVEIYSPDAALRALLPDAKGKNLAPAAKITADSQFSADWGPQFVADGIVPDVGAMPDSKKAWAVVGKTHRRAAALTFEWAKPVTISQVVYYGRTACVMEDCFSRYQIFLDDAKTPAATGRFRMIHGPQRITLLAPQQARKMTVKFAAAYGGGNPGASEVQVFASIAGPKQLIACKPPRSRGRKPAQPVATLADLQEHLENNDSLSAAETLRLIAESTGLTDDMLDIAAKLLSHGDRFVSGLAEWAIARHVGRENNGEVAKFTPPVKNPPKWYRTWTAFGLDSRIQMDYVRQAVALGIHRDEAKLAASMNDMLRRAKLVAAEIAAAYPMTLKGPITHARYTKLTRHEQDTVRRREIADVSLALVQTFCHNFATTQARKPGDMAGLRSWWLSAREALRRLVLVSPGVDFDSIIFYTRFAPHHKPNVCGTHTSWTYKPGGDICILEGLNFGGKVRRVLKGKLNVGHVHGFDLWFDADRITFGYARQPKWPPVKPTLWPQPGNQCYAFELRHDQKPGHIFEINADGTGLKQLTNHPFWTDVEPTYTPNGDVAFTSDRSSHAPSCDSYINDLTDLNIYAVSASNGELRRLTNQKDVDRHPHLMHNGLIAYLRWEYQERHFWDVHSIWTVRPDGTMNDAMFKQHLGSPVSVREFRSIPNSKKMVAVAAGHHVFPVGPLVILNPAGGMNAAAGVKTLTVGPKPQERSPVWKGKRAWEQNIVEGGGVIDAGGFYMTPYPLSESCFLASYAYGSRHARKYGNVHGDVDSNGAGVYLIDRYGNKELIFRDPVYSAMSPMPFAPRKRPPAMIPMTDPTKNYATCIVTDVYEGLTGIERGRVKHIRIAEALPWPVVPGEGSREWFGRNWDLPKTRWCPVRVIGTVPVESDGSAHFKAPTVENASVYFQALDENYMELRRMRSSVSFQPGEIRSCNGCHESRSATSGASPQTTRPMATKREPSMPIAPPWGCEKPIGYEWLVQPILDKHCVKCHSPAAEGGKPKANLDFSSKRAGRAQTFQSYRTLITAKGGSKHKGPLLALSNRESDGSVTQPLQFGSHKSFLVQHLRAGHSKVKLSQAEWIALVTWIDANAPYHHLMVNKHPRDGGAHRRVEHKWAHPWRLVTPVSATARTARTTKTR